MSGRSSRSPTTTSTCGRIRTSASRQSRICFDGAMLHRDSLGSVQRIEPGAINWMTAGAASCIRSARRRIFAASRIRCMACSCGRLLPKAMRRPRTRRPQPFPNAAGRRGYAAADRRASVRSPADVRASALPRRRRSEARMVVPGIPPRSSARPTASTTSGIDEPRFGGTRWPCSRPAWTRPSTRRAARARDHRRRAARRPPHPVPSEFRVVARSADRSGQGDWQAQRHGDPASTTSSAAKADTRRVRLYGRHDRAGTPPAPRIRRPLRLR